MLILNDYGRKTRGPAQAGGGRGSVAGGAMQRRQGRVPAVVVVGRGQRPRRDAGLGAWRGSRAAHAAEPCARAAGRAGARRGEGGLLLRGRLHCVISHDGGRRSCLS